MKYDQFVETFKEELTSIYNQSLDLWNEIEMSFDEFCAEIFVEIPDELWAN